MPIRVVNPALSSPQTPTAEALQRERQTQQANDEYAYNQDFIAKQQQEQVKAQRAQKAAAADAEQARKHQIANAKRAGVQTRVDPTTGQEDIARHEDGAPVYQAGFVGKPQVSDKGGVAKYRDARGTSYPVPFDQIRTEQDPSGETFYSFDVTGQDGTKQTFRQPAGTKPLFRTDPTTGNRLADMTDPTTGSVQTQVVGIDRPTASKAAVAKRRDAIQLRQNEISGESAMLAAQQNAKQTDLGREKEKLKAAQDAYDKIAKGKERYEMRPLKDNPNTLAPHLITDFGGQEAAIPVDSSRPDDVRKAQSWMEQSKSAEKALADAKAAHDPLDAEVFGMQKQRDQLAIRILEEKRKGEQEIKLMQDAEKRGANIWEPDFQKKINELANDKRYHDVSTLAELEAKNDSMVEDVKKAVRTDAALNAALEAGMVSEDSPLAIARTKDSKGAMVDAPRAKLVDTLTAGLTAGKPATVTDAKAAKELATKSLGMQPDGVEVSEQKPEGHYELSRNGEIFASLDPRNNRLTLLDTPSSLQDKGAEIIANASPDGVPVYMVSSEQPYKPAEVRDLIETGINAARAAKTEEETASALAAVGLDSAGIRQKVMAGKLSVQDGKLFNDKLNGVQQVNLSAQGMQEGFGKWLNDPKNLWGNLFRNGTPNDKTKVANIYADTVAAQAKNGVFRSNSLLAENRKALVSKFGGGEEGGMWKSVTSGIKQLPGFAWNAAMVVPRLMDKYVVNPNDNWESTNLFHDQTKNLVDRLLVEQAPWKKDASPMGAALGEIEAWADKAESVDDLPDELANKLAEAAYTNYHGFKNDGIGGANVDTTRDNYDVKRDPVLRKMLQQYLDSGDSSALQSLHHMLKSNVAERQTDIALNQYIERPRVATPKEVAARASLLNIPLDPVKSTAILALAKEGESVKDQAGADAIMKRAGQILGLDPEQASMAMAEITRNEVTDPDSWTGQFRGTSVADAGELASEFVVDWALAGMTATVVGAPEAAAIKAAQVGAKGLRASAARYAAHQLDNFASRSATFAKVRTAIGKGRAAMRSSVDELAADFQGLGIQKPVFGGALTTGQKLSNAAVSTVKAVAAGAPMEATEEAVMAMVSNDPSLENITDSALQGAAGVIGLVPAFAGVRGLQNAYTKRGQVKEWEKHKQGIIDSVNTDMAKVPGFKPLTTADFDAWQGLQGSPAHQEAAGEYVAAKREFDQQAEAFAQASQAGPVAPAPSFLAAKTNLEAATQNLAGMSQTAFTAMDELRALPDAERPLYTAAAKAAAGATDYTEAEAKALMQQSGANAVIFQQATPLPSGVQGPVQVKNLANIPTVTQAAPAVYRLPDGVRLNVPQPLMDMLAQKAPSMTLLAGNPTNLAGTATTPANTKQAKTTQSHGKENDQKGRQKGRQTLLEPDQPKAGEAQTSPAATAETAEGQKPWEVAKKNIKPYVDSLRGMTDKQLKAEEKRAAAELNAVPKLSGDRVKYHEISEKFNAVNREIDARKNGKTPTAATTGAQAQAGTKITLDNGENFAKKIIGQFRASQKGIAKRFVEDDTLGGTIAPGDNASGLVTTADETDSKGMPVFRILFSPRLLAQDLNGFDEATATKRLLAMLDEEVRHVAALEAAKRVWLKQARKDFKNAPKLRGQEFDNWHAALIQSGSTFRVWRNDHYAQLWNEHFTPEMRAEVRKGRNGAMNEADWVLAFEGLRMIDQLERTGSITEMVLAELAELLAALQNLLELVRTGQKKAIKDEITAIRAILAEYGYENGTVQPAKAKKKASTPKVKEAAKPADKSKDEAVSLKSPVGSPETAPESEQSNSDMSTGAVDGVKQPWHMTRTEFIEKNGRRPMGMKDDPNAPKTIGARISTLPNGETWNTDEHGQEVYAALLRGQNVPTEVLAEYPMLKDVKATTDQTAPELPPVEKAPPGSPDLAKPTIAADKHWLFDTQAGDVAAMSEGRNVFIVAHFTKLKDAKEAMAKINQGKDGPARIEAWLAKPKKEGGKVVSKWAVFIPNVTQDFVDEFNVIKAKDQAPAVVVNETPVGGKQPVLPSTGEQQPSDPAKPKSGASTASIDKIKGAFDGLASAPASQDPAVNALRELAEVDELFRYPVSDEYDLPAVMNDVWPGSQYVGDATRMDEEQESGADKRFMFLSPKGREFYVHQSGRKGSGEVWIDVSRFQEGDFGSAVYAAVGQYAKNTKRTFVGDPAGVSEAATVRRTSAMLSLALQQGTTEWIEPSESQLAGMPEKGIAPLQWKGNYSAKVRSLIETFLATTQTQFPGIEDARYDFTTGQYLGQSGLPIDWRALLRAADDPRARASRAGTATLRRAIFLRSLLEETSRQESRLLQDIQSWRNRLSGRGLSQLFSAPASQQVGLPKERRAAFLDVAESLIADGVNTPEALARALNEARPDGSLRKYSQALWNFFGTIEPNLTGQHDWTAIYAGIDKPLPEVEDSPDESNLVQRPNGAESGNADVTGETGPEIGASGGRMGGDESGAPETVGNGQDSNPEGAGIPEPTGTSGGTSGSGRNDASIGSGDRGDVRGESQPRVEATANYTITDADKIGEGGLKAKYADNIAAIRLVKQLQAANRKPTTAEQKILVRYVGWGGMKNVFDGTNAKWADEHKEVKDLLSDDEFSAARRSTMDAHYTSPTVIKNGIWGALRRFGFKGGKMLEGGVGIGHMIGLMPGEMRPASSYLGIEKDPITAQIAAYLYPEASIHSTGFEQATVERDHFDAAAGNPPFGQQQLYDPNFKAASKFSIHNYFIAKHIEALRVGGVGAWVVSHNFLDALDPAAREYIASKAEFLGAIRLPNTSFKANANTEVTTDIVYFRRVAEGTATDTTWTKSTKQADKDGNAYSLNDWINNHRDMILGTLETTSSMYGPGELTVTAPPTQDLALDLAAAVENLPADVYDNDPSGANIRLATPEFIPVPDSVRVGAYFIGEKGELRRRLSDSNMERRSAPVEMPEGTAERVRGMVELRDAFNEVVAAELNNSADEQELGALRAEMNRVYDAFVKKHGLLHQTGNRRAFFSDPHAARILGLESDYDAGVSAPTAKKNNVPARKPSAKKADIFTRRVNSPYSEITKVETAKEALTVALNQRGLVDLDYMTQLSGINRDTLLRELTGLIFETPQSEWQVASQYLSGNVRKKLAEAEAAAKDDPRFNTNVEALKAVQPPDLEATQVTVTPGAPWIMADVLKQFALDLTGEDATAVVYNSANGGWIFQHPSNSTNATQVWGTTKADFSTLFTNILNNKPTIIHLPRGTDDPYVVDAQNTALAQAKADAIRDKWATWIWEDQSRRDALLKIYNDKFNVYVDPKYDGSHLTLPGISNVVTLRPHQKDVVWRIMTDLTTLLDHVVGAGKTFAGVAAFMELRRLGRVRKPMFAVPNHLVTQWRDDFVKLYPNANVLFARPSDFKKDKRQQLFAKIMTGEYDAVIVGHSSLKKIRMSPEIERELLNEMLAEIIDTLKAVADAEGKRGSRVQTQLERQKEALEAKLARLADIGSGDEVATFEELGIDGLFVDEAHEFKNLFYTTQMQNVAGLGNPAGSAKAFDLYLKSRHLRKRYGGKAPLVFATGTPISNSLVEMFTMQRYLQPDVLDSMGIKTLDAWAKVFATVKQVYEVNPTGTGMRLATRLAQFQNVGDLSAVYRTVADVITMSDLFAQAKEQGKKFPIPKVKGGKPQIYAVERTPEQESYFGVETQRTTDTGEPIYDSEGNPIFDYPKGSINWRVDNMPDDTREDNMLKLTSDARKAALDMRLVDPNAADRPESKINTTVRNILATAKQWDAEKGTQLVFCDLSVPSSARGKAKAKAMEAIGKIYWIRKNGRIERVEKAEPVTIPGFEEFGFFIRKEGREWMVTETSSGARISKGDTKAGAIAQAANRITPMGVDKFRDAVAKNVPDTEELAAFFAEQEAAAPEKDDTEESDVADDSEVSVSMDELLAEQSTFSVYDDLKAKLIAGGLAPNQVEFIHDHDSPEKKAILFARMNKGDVRVLIGSTPKLGAGTNVQKKLVELHHMDAPWRPSDLEQREGRIIRQGNEFYEADPDGFEVGINRYATKMTYDTRMWQIIEHKAAGIEGFRRAERTTRVLEDVSGEAANAAEMKAASSGDPRIAREIMLRNDIAKLQALFDGWRQNRYRTESRINALGDHPRTHESLKNDRQALIAKRDSATTAEFSYQLPSGKKVAKKADTLAPIVEIIKAAKPGDQVAVGRYRGFMFTVEKRDYHMGGNFLTFRSALIGAPSTQFRDVTTIYPNEELSGTGLMQRFDNYLASFEGDITRDAAGVVRSLKERNELKETLKEGFKDEGKLESMKAEHAALRAELMQSRGRRATPSATPTSEEEGRGLSSAPSSSQMPRDRAERIIANLAAKEQAGKLNAKEREALDEARSVVSGGTLASAPAAKNPGNSKGWLEPSGKFHALRRTADTHENWALDHLGLTVGFDDFVASNKLHEQGWIRTVPEKNHIWVSTTSSRKPTNAQIRELRDSAIEAGKDEVRFVDPNTISKLYERPAGESLASAPSRRLGRGLADMMPTKPAQGINSTPTDSKLTPASFANIAKAYRAVQNGTSSQFVPIKAVFQRIKAASPETSPDAFMAEIQAADTRGDIMVEAPERPETIQQAGPFVVRNALGVPSTNMMVVDNGSNSLASAPSPKTPTQQAIYEIRNQLNTANAGRSEYPVPEERLNQQAKSLLQWAVRQGKTIAPADFERATTRHAGLGGGEEHDVWYDASRGRVVKLTKPGAYGIQQDLTRYLDTIEYSNRVFGDDIILEGVIEINGWPHILISQPFYRGEMLPQPEIDGYFAASHGAQSTGRPASYLMPDGARVYDAKPRNVLRLTNGEVQPIDVQVALASAPSKSKETEKEKQAREILESLPPIWRDVLQDHWNDKTIEQIAAERNLPLDRVGYALRMGQGRFNILMAKNVATPEVAVEDGIVKAKFGRPDLAMSGNAVMAAVDQRRMTLEEVTHAEMQELAVRMFDVAPDDAESLVSRYLDSNGTDMRTDGMSPALQAIVSDAQGRNAVQMLMMAASQLYTVRKTMAGKGNSIQLVRLGWAWRDLGTETARALSMRQDPFDSPEERAAYYLQDSLLTPPDGIRNELRRNPANKERILAAWAARADQIKAEMLAEGIDLDATFRELAKEQKLADETIPEPVKPVLARAPKKTRQLVKAILQGLKPSKAIAAAGLTAKAAFKAYQAFRETINQAGQAAAKGMQDQMLRSAPAADFAANMGLPELTEAEWLDAVKADKPLRTTPATEALKEQRERKKVGGEIDLKNRKSRRKALDAIAIRKSNAFDKMSEFWRASILSGPQTHVVNLVSGLTFGTYEATFKKMATGAQADIARMFGLKPDAASLSDVPAMISAVLPSIKQAFLAGIGEWQTQSNVFDAYAMNLKDAEGQSFKESYAPALKGILGKIMRGISFRAMGAADAFVKSFFTRIEVVAQARQIARNENLEGEAFRNRIAELTNEVGSIAWERALAQAKRITFQNEEVHTANGTVKLDSPLTAGSRAIDRGFDWLPNLISRAKRSDYSMLKGLAHFTFPFVDTPANIFKTGVTMSPIGGLLAIIDATRSLMRRQKGNTEEATKIYNAARALDDLTNQLVAWGFILGLSELVKPGDDDEELPFMTGSPDYTNTSTGERELMYRTAPPYSIRIGNRWISYKRLDPFASSLSFTIDAIRQFQSGKPLDEVWGRVGMGLMTTLKDKTFLQGVSDVVNAIQDPERFGTKWATNIAIGFIPNLIRQPIRTADPVFRESDLANDLGFWDNLGRRVGYGIYPQGAMPAFDIWGREAAKNTGTGGPNTDWMLRLLSPMDMKDADNVDSLDVALLRYNYTHSDEPFGVTAPSREISRTIGGKVIKVSLDDAEYSDFLKKAGQTARANFGDTYKGRILTEKDVEDIKDAIQKVQGIYRDAAFVSAVQKRGGVNALANTTK